MQERDTSGVLCLQLQSCWRLCSAISAGEGQEDYTCRIPLKKLCFFFKSACIGLVSLQSESGVARFNNFSMPTNGPRPNLASYKKSKWNLHYKRTLFCMCTCRAPRKKQDARFCWNGEQELKSPDFVESQSFSNMQAFQFGNGNCFGHDGWVGDSFSINCCNPCVFSGTSCTESFPHCPEFYTL